MSAINLPYPIVNMQRDRYSFWMTAILALLLFALLIPFADFDGYEGDDLNSVVPMLYLEPAKAGAFLIYRYDWQPLFYELGAALYRLTNSPDAIFALAPLSAALSIALMVQLARPQTGFIVALGLVALAPELIYSGLYYNTTIIGLPLLLLAMVLLRQMGWASLVAGGVSLGLAILMRMDFMMTGPALALLAAEARRDARAPIVLTAACLAFLTGAYAFGVLDAEGILAQYRIAAQEIADKAHLPGWDARTKLFVATTLLSPAGWLLTASVLLVVIIDGIRRSPIRLVLWIAASVPMLLLVSAPLSPKYGLPILPFWLLLMAASARMSPVALRTAGPLLLGVASAQMVVSITPQRDTPYVNVGLKPAKSVGTHDGPRAYGGTIWLVRDLAGHTGDPSAQQLAQGLAAGVRAGARVTFTGGENFFDEGGIAWRRASILLARAGARSEPQGSGRLTWTLGNGALILRSEAASVTSMPQGRATLTASRTARDQHAGGLRSCQHRYRRGDIALSMAGNRGSEPVEFVADCKRIFTP